MFSRRRFLAGCTGLSSAIALPGLANGPENRLTTQTDSDTGLPLLRLPPGFRYVTYGWMGDVMDDGIATPGLHDGMAVVHAKGSELTLVRNHELFGRGGSFGPEPITYDPSGPGGTTTLTFDAKRGQFLSARASLAGTLINCAGGPTPWGSWLSCEEVVADPGALVKWRQLGLTRRHGYVFEVPAKSPASAEPITAMGQFIHEAVAVDPADGIVYLTEDRYVAAGFYRYIPDHPEQLARGGRLQMMRVRGRDQMIRDVPRRKFDVEWVDIEKPEMGHVNDEHQDSSGVVSQGLAGGATAFSRLEGCWLEDGMVAFTSTNGGNAGRGQVFRMIPSEQTVEMIYEAPSAHLLDHPDNVTIAPGGIVVICEDGSRYGQMITALKPDGQLVGIAQNNVDLAGQHNGFAGDFRESEWCGACFSPDGEWLFANIQKPGITVAITGPWESLFA